MNRTVAELLLASLILSYPAAAAAQVKMSGDASLLANDWINPKGTKTSDSLTLWERFRLRTDFTANEDLKFRLSIRANNKGQLQSQ